MSEDTEVEEIVTDTVEAPEGQADPPELSAEDRALAMGWTPQGQFKGDPSKWVDAETFVKRGEEFLPFLKANNKRLEQALERANTKIASLDKAVTRSIEHISRADQRAYEKARRDLEAELDQAAAAGDTESVRAVTKDIVELEKGVTAKSDKGEPEESAVVASWKAANAWYEKDPVMKAAAYAIADQLVAEGVVEPATQLAEVTRRIKAEFPHKFENPNRRAAAAVEGSGAPIRRGGKSYSDLPADAKQMCDEFVRDIPGFTREKYVSTYAWENTK